MPCVAWPSRPQVLFGSTLSALLLDRVLVTPERYPFLDNTARVKPCLLDHLVSDVPVKMPRYSMVASHTFPTRD
ncbi:hypothetical protein EV702DRAFT_327404 [Suillus placidus]|uniref:Uncharacterized protein n=1 Tax=Suillus placidus TaxID=48579 RepID=A0A9P6ZTU0_9AGAM|nr:hypothetical protein EV702DRAFT_327404 [Suillus placidus]